MKAKPERTTAENQSMNFDEIVRKRVSVRAFDSRPVPPEHITAMCKAARLAPSACNSQTWRFVAVTDRALLDRICDEGSRAIVRNRWMKEAPLIFACCSQLDIVANRVGTAVTGIEYYQIDLGIATEHLVLKATELGLGTCWVGWFNEAKVKEILAIPKRVRVSVLIAVGYPKEETPVVRARKPLKEIVFDNRWGEEWQQPE